MISLEAAYRELRIKWERTSQNAPECWKSRGAASTYVEMEIAQSRNLCVGITQEAFTDDLQLLPAFTELRSQRERPLEPEEVSFR